MEKYAVLTIVELKNLLRARGASLQGKKKDLIERLIAYDKNNNFCVKPNLSTEDYDNETKSLSMPEKSRFKDINADTNLPSVTLTNIKNYLLSNLLYLGHSVRNIATKEGYERAAVAANGEECAGIGREILSRGGSAADAAIATLFCEGVSCAQCTGLGGGFLLTGRDPTGALYVLDARDVAPAATAVDLYEGGNKSTTVGGLASTVPGELRGYGALHARYGRLPWAELVRPAAELCRTGHRVTAYLARVLENYRDRILAEPSLREVYVDPRSGDVWKEGDLVRRPQLAATLDVVAHEGPDALHAGSLTQAFIDDVRIAGGVITVKDMNDYRPLWKEPLEIKLTNELTLHSVGLPGSGHILAFILNMLNGWVGGDDAPAGSLLYWHRIVETFKYAFAKRTALGDEDFLEPKYVNEALRNLSRDAALSLREAVHDDETHSDWRHYGASFDVSEDHGTAHVSVLGPDGDAIAVTSTINFVFGAFRRSPQTGIILNNQMDNFSHPGQTSVYGLPPSPSNFPQPGKRPLSSMCPSLVVDTADRVHMVLGAAGGTKITTQVVLILLEYILLSNSDVTKLEEIISQPRLHHQLLPMTIEHEYNFPPKILEQLHTLGHETTELASTSGFAAATGIAVGASGHLWPFTDPRRPGSADGF